MARQCEDTPFQPVVPDLDFRVITSGHEERLVRVEVHGAHWPFVLLESVYQGSHPVVPELDLSGVQGCEDPWTLWVEAQTLNTVGAGLELDEDRVLRRRGIGRHVLFLPLLPEEQNLPHDMFPVEGCGWVLWQCRGGWQKEKSEVDSANASRKQAPTLHGLSNPGVLHLGVADKETVSREKKRYMWGGGSFGLPRRLFPHSHIRETASLYTTRDLPPVYEACSIILAARGVKGWEGGGTAVPRLNRGDGVGAQSQPKDFSTSFAGKKKTKVVKLT